MTSKQVRLSTLGLMAVLALPACKRSFHEGSDVEAVLENERWYSNRVSTADDAQAGLTDTALGIDVRGVGDAGWADGAFASRPSAAGFGAALRANDPHRRIFKGDLSFINWETVTGVSCPDQRTSVDYFFLSHPDNVTQAVDFGFNLWGLANNHAQDCNRGKAFADSETKHGPLMTAEVLEKAGQNSAVLWHGAGAAPHPAKVRTFTIRGQSVKVAFAAISIIGWEIPNSSYVNFGGDTSRAQQVLQSFKPDDPGFADIRILSLHTQDASGNNRQEAGAVLLLKKLGEEFIKKYKGNVVFGHGPHTWAGVKAVETDDGRRGVIFASLGNFIHQGLGSNGDNYVARAILAPGTWEVRQVQVFPFRNDGGHVAFSGARSMLSNFPWRTGSTSPGAMFASFPATRVAVSPIECPNGYRQEKVGSGLLCTDGQNAWGPFTQAMISKCLEWGGGEPACKGDRWSLDMAKNARGSGVCPVGSSLDRATGYCAEGSDAFGPFPKELVSKCEGQGGGPACASARWSLTFLRGLMAR